MRKTLLAAALLLATGVASAQHLNADTSSNAGAASNSESYSGSASQSGGNTINPNQQVGVGFTQTYEASVIPTDTTTRLKTNSAVPLAAAVSFSSDYCGGTASGGASAAGISIGVAKPLMDGNCQSMRRSEKFGTAAANAYNAGLHEVAGKLIMMQIWEICNAGNDSVQSLTSEACQRLALIGEGVMPHDAPAHEQLPSPASATTPKSEQAAKSEAPTDSVAQKARITGSNGVSAEVEEAKKVK